MFLDPASDRKGVVCPDCGSKDVEDGDEVGWRRCLSCSLDWLPGQSKWNLEGCPDCLSEEIEVEQGEFKCRDCGETWRLE